MNSVIAQMSEMLLYHDAKFIVFCHPRRRNIQNEIPLGGNVLYPWNSLPQKHLTIVSCTERGIDFLEQDTAFSQNPIRRQFNF